MRRLSGHHWDHWRDLHRVHRLEYPFPIAYVCHALWGACYAVTALDQLVRAPVLAVIAANTITLVAQNVLNAAMDISIDAKTPGKTGIAHATQRLGRNRLIRYALLEMALALLLATGAAVYLGRPVVTVGVAAGVLVELLYNLEPIRLTKRGLANPASLGLHFSFLPCVSTFNAVRPDYPGFIWPAVDRVPLRRPAGRSNPRPQRHEVPTGRQRFNDPQRDPERPHGFSGTKDVLFVHALRRSPPDKC
jgi:4-hydroxybenzoate polyprenyltransferase